MIKESKDDKLICSVHWKSMLFEVCIGSIFFYFIFDGTLLLVVLGGLLSGWLSYRMRTNKTILILKYGLESIKRFFKKLGWLPILGIFLYVLWCLGLMVFIGKVSTGFTMLDYIIRPSVAPSEFIISYAASSLDSLIFFFLVGVLLAINSMRQPEDEKLSRKIEHIFPTVPTESKLLKYLIDKISKLACVNMHTERIITISDYSKDDNFIKLSIKSHSVIKNMHNNHDFSVTDMPWSFGVDDCKPGESVLGEIHEISVVHKIGSASEEKHILDGIATLTSKNKKHSESHSLNLMPEQEVLYQTNAWAWESINKEWTFNSSRYTEKRCFKIINKTDLKFTLETKCEIVSKDDIAKMNVESQEYVIGKSSSSTDDKIVKFYHEKLLPNESITLTFKLLKPTTLGGGVSVTKQSDATEKQVVC